MNKEKLIKEAIDKTAKYKIEDVIAYNVNGKENIAIVKGIRIELNPDGYFVNYMMSSKNKKGRSLCIRESDVTQKFIEDIEE